LPTKGLPRPLSSERSTPTAGPRLERTLAAIEGKLHTLYARGDPEDEARRLALILAAEDPHSPLWDELLQITYLEIAREGLQDTLQSLDRYHGRLH